MGQSEQKNNLLEKFKTFFKTKTNPELEKKSLTKKNVRIFISPKSVAHVSTEDLFKSDKFWSQLDDVRIFTEQKKPINKTEPQTQEGLGKREAHT